MIPRHVIDGAVELLESGFNGTQLGECLVLIGRLILVLQIAEFNQKIDLFPVHHTHALVHFPQRLAVITLPARRHVRIMRVGHYAQADGFSVPLGSGGRQ